MQDELGCFVLQIGWVAVFSEDAFNQNFDFGAGAFAERPVDGDAFADLGDKFGRDHFEVVFAHDLEGAVVCGERVVERDFVVVQSEIDAALIASLISLASLISSSMTSCVAIARL